MTPGARLAAAMAILDAWIAGAAAEQALTNWARGARYAGSGDRAAVRDHVYDVLRARGTCAALGGGEDARALVIGLLRMQGLDPDSLFDGQGHAPAPLSEAERAGGAPPEATADVPDWTLPMLEARVGGDLAQLMSRLRDRAPVYLRVNLRRCDRAAAIAGLARDEVGAEEITDCATALVVTSGARRIKSAAAYRDGLVELQDLSVQRALAAVDWPGGRILDYCAGGGGKALAIADRTAGQVFAHDANPGRMADLGPRAERAGVAIQQVAGAALARMGRFEAVLCDVPCSGSGTWRRDPEAKWRLTPARLDALLGVQAAILTEAAPLVTPGGMLVYMTCSLFPCENEAQVERFLAAHPGWSLDRAGCDTPLTASDGFFHTVLRAPEA
ncbi:RsmB/NOP family class I SAM-dependent RNA methyltransferase [Roseicyclus marinus]|uniref:RsmB/NOP family class I SAM-dependent RNA methyltransferase n=1 Tax=Roseicyclus marinus TaxID=2161673 RepID=UPI00240EF42E|nr:RsmB/NOP family class I SAM-dependent RNA methyltransferase [Roseicyclus marinus]MDG3039985.1 RsmB/NOP family class I SAM-dependent RNA methyltransferase [Roseicyclus marinus]